MTRIDYARLPSLAADQMVVRLAWVKPAWLSLRSAGDRGPSGPAGSRRRAELAQWLDPAQADQPIIACRQSHSLRILSLAAESPPELWEGAWSKTADGQSDHLTVWRQPIPNRSENRSPEAIAALAGDCEADGIMTNRPLRLGVTVADCLPIGLCCGDWHGVLHSGWQGTGILLVALRIIEQIKPAATGQILHLLLGPAIAVGDYPVPAERANGFARRFGPQSTARLDSCQPAINLQTANMAIAESWQAQSGLDIQIVAYRDSTFRHDNLQSYRRDGQAYGRMLFIVEP